MHICTGANIFLPVKLEIKPSIWLSSNAFVGLYGWIALREK